MVFHLNLILFEMIVVKLSFAVEEQYSKYTTNIILFHQITINNSTVEGDIHLI